MNTQEQAAALELYITTSDKATLDAVAIAFCHARLAVDRSAHALAEHRAKWHDDPEGDPQGYAGYHAPAAEQFNAEARAAVVVELFERCERVRRENIVNLDVKTGELS